MYYFLPSRLIKHSPSIFQSLKLCAWNYVFCLPLKATLAASEKEEDSTVPKVTGLKIESNHFLQCALGYSPENKPFLSRFTIWHIETEGS